MKNLKVGIIGCGNMGTAIIRAVFSAGGGSAFGGGSRFSVFAYDVDRKKTKGILKKYKIRVASNSTDLVKRCDIIILAVKPKDIERVLRGVKGNLNVSKILISIAAGISTEFIEGKIGRKISVIRVMPNMPALIQSGISAICKGRFATNRDLAVAQGLFKNIGEVIVVKENLMDAITVISGSGPAYFFYLVEVLVKAALELGIEKRIAKKLVVETALGSAKVLKLTDETPWGLRAKVTSKGGTTEAAFKEFFKSDLEGILKKGIRKAFCRAVEIRKVPRR